MLETVLARGPLFLLDQAAELGVDRSGLLAAADLRDEDLRDPDSRVPVARFVAIWKELVRQRPEPDLGFRLGSAMRVHDLGLVGYLMINSADLEKALRRLAHFSHILGDANRTSLSIEGDTGVLNWEPDSRLETIPQATDWILSALLNASEELTGAGLEPPEVHFPYSEPPSGDAGFGHPRTRRLWGQRRPALVFTRQDLQRPVTGADSTLGTYLEQHAETVLASLPAQQSSSGQARRAIWSRLRDGEPTLERVAETLKMTPRTLQRRLNDEGTSFSELLDEVRRTLATSLLRDDSLGIHEIAFLLGYSEPSAFNRAFRRWRQLSPSEFRASARAAG